MDKKKVKALYKRRTVNHIPDGDLERINLLCRKLYGTQKTKRVMKDRKLRKKRKTREVMKEIVPNSITLSSGYMSLENELFALLRKYRVNINELQKAEV